ncbi:helix-turn-helix transcriptional regulator [uncultured Bacteroides sp.]|uniref:helix-turn-helix domain-containing protein n=1 Tax=uncultured Bacteroides sp. TaxID=162156 RepID=UPI002630BBD7|nr:helix-turn-helix transcriptional regulator [uncultured Bacteroides sp.]
MKGGRNLNTVVIPNIRRIIDERGLKQYAVAEKAGYTKQQFNAMLTGRKLITDIDICKITSALNVDANTLFMVRRGEEP